MKILLSLMVIGTFVLVSGYTAGIASGAKYVGVKTCRKCHKSKKSGRQFGIWKKSKHSKTFELLGTDQAKKAARKIKVSGDPQKTEACLVCHTTGYGEDKGMFGKKFVMEDGVQCESCHGAGSEYKGKKTMKKIAKERGPDRKGVSATAQRLGLTYPDEKTCKRCHSPEITYKGKVYKNPKYEDFDFDKYFEKIKHPKKR